MHEAIKKTPDLKANLRDLEELRKEFVIDQTSFKLIDKETGAPSKKRKRSPD